ncbi:MAG: DUF935 family protein [Betaproteobacteria bacterium]
MDSTTIQATTDRAEVSSSVSTFAASAEGSGSLVTPFVIDRFVNQLSFLGDYDEAMNSLGVTRSQLRQMESDDEISQGLDTRRDACTDTPWHLDGEESEAFDQLKLDLNRWARPILRAAWEAVPYGYSIIQVYWGPRLKQRYGIDGVEDMNIDRFRLNRGEIIFLGASGAISRMGEVMDPRKFFATVRNAKWHRRHGDAILSKLYWPWFFRMHGWNFWMKYLERCGTPIVVGETKGDPKKMAASLEKAVQDAVIAVADGDKVNMLESGRNPAIFVEWNKAVTARIAKVILGQTLTSDIGDKGSFAAAKVHSEVLEQKRLADVSLVTETMQSIINQYWFENKFAGEVPRFRMHDDIGLNLELAERNLKITQADPTARFTPKHYEKGFGLTQEDIFFVEGQKPTAAPPVEKTVNASADLFLHSLNFAAGVKQETPAQDNVDAIAKAAAEQYKSDLAQQVMIEVKKAADPADLQQRIVALAGNLEDDDLRKLIEKAVFAADVLGWTGAEGRIQ